MGLERPGRVVQDDARGTEVGQLPRVLHELVRLARLARTVDEPGVELAARGLDRLGPLAEVLDVVQRVVQPDDVDPVLGRGSHEAADGPAADPAGALAAAPPERPSDAGDP